LSLQAYEISNNQQGKHHNFFVLQEAFQATPQPMVLIHIQRLSVHYKQPVKVKGHIRAKRQVSKLNIVIE
jgi:hypothetical protein